MYELVPVAYMRNMVVVSRTGSSGSCRSDKRGWTVVDLPGALLDVAWSGKRIVGFAGCEKNRDSNQVSGRAPGKILGTASELSNVYLSFPNHFGAQILPRTRGWALL